jgi:hypothetical protein
MRLVANSQMRDHYPAALGQTVGINTFSLQAGMVRGAQ